MHYVDIKALIIFQWYILPPKLTIFIFRILDIIQPLPSSVQCEESYDKIWE